MTVLIGLRNRWVETEPADMMTYVNFDTLIGQIC